MHNLAELRQLPSCKRILGTDSAVARSQLGMLLSDLFEQLYQVLPCNAEGLGHRQATGVVVDGLQLPVLSHCQDSPLVVGIASCKEGKASLSSRPTSQGKMNCSETTLNIILGRDATTPCYNSMLS